MKQFKTDLYEGVPPFACCLYHKDLHPKDESFLDMLRFTFLPYFQLYSFTFFWIVVVAFVYICSLSMGSTNVQDEFLKVSQSALFELGENYPYYSVKKYHYYRIFTSLVLFRNLYHFIMGSVGILICSSYIEELVGFKRTFLLSITAGVGGELIRNAFIYSASIQSLTPICGLIGYLIGLFLVNMDTRWKYNHKEKIHMIIIILLITLPYVQMGSNYGNVSLLSMAAGFVIGFTFFFCDPNSEKHIKYRVPSIIFLVSGIGIATFYFLFKSQPSLVQIR